MASPAIDLSAIISLITQLLPLIIIFALLPMLLRLFSGVFGD
ncbi:MAG: hypothetical protein QXM12_01725 [Nitrososphaerota archaeon]